MTLQTVGHGSTPSQPSYVQVVNAILASDAATETKQNAIVALLTTLASTDFATQTTLAAVLADLQLKADLTETQPVSAISLPLPTGAATAAGQLPDGHNVTVTNPTANPETGLAKEGTLQALEAKDFATETSLAGALTRLGEVSATPTANTVLERLKQIQDSLAAIDLDTNGLNQETTQQAVLAAVDGVEALLTSLDGKDFSTAANQSEQIQNFGAKADTPATTDTGTFSLLALLKRLLQRFNSGTTIGAVEQAGTWTVAQGAAGATPWPVDISGATVDIGNLQQLANATDINETHDLQAAAYTKNVAYANDSTLKYLSVALSTAEQPTVAVTATYGGITKYIVNPRVITSSPFEVEFEEKGEVDSGATVTVTLTQTAGACTATVVLLSQIGTSALGGTPVVDQGVGSTTGRPWRTIDSVHSDLHAGVLYSGAAYNSAVADGSALNVLIQTGAVDTHIVVNATSTGDAEMVLYEGTTFSAAGTAVSMSNHNRQSANVASFTVTHTPTVTTTGTQINGTLLIPGGTKAAGSGGHNAFIEEWVLKQNEKYLIRLTNNSGGSQKLNIEVRAYERNI